MHGVMDLIHKKVNPKTYPCKLCQITYSGATINKLWKQYVTNLDIPACFMHKNEFVKTYPKTNVTFPAILLKTDKTFKLLISSNDFKHIDGLSDLMETLNSKMSDKQQLYQCQECGLHYTNKALVKKCTAWCRKYKSCNLEITKLSIEVQGSKNK